MNIKKLIPYFTEEVDDNYPYAFTVFTPVYNAEKSLNRVHEALKLQNYKDFEWLVINDGSTDSSHTVMQDICNKSDLNIRYINNSVNKHKMACFMQGVRLASGAFFLTLDADDSCEPNALQELQEAYQNIPDDVKPKIASVTGLCKDQYGNIIGTKFPEGCEFSDVFESYNIHKVTGEKWGFTKTNVLRGIHYDREFVEHGFMLEGLLWSLLAKTGYKTYYFNKVLRTYFLEVEGSISGSTPEKVALAQVVYNSTMVNWFFSSYWSKIPAYFLKRLFFIVSYGYHSKLKLSAITKSIDVSIFNFLIIILWPARSLFKLRK